MAGRGPAAVRAIDPGRSVGAGDHLAAPDDLELRGDVGGGDGVEHAATGAAHVEPEHQAGVGGVPRPRLVHRQKRRW